MEKQTKELGAVAVAGRVLYELMECDANHVTLTNTQNSEQYIIIEKEALPGIASILLKAAKAGESNRHF
jgi:hypothetical protein